MWLFNSVRQLVVLQWYYLHLIHSSPLHLRVQILCRHPGIFPPFTSIPPPPPSPCVWHSFNFFSFCAGSGGCRQGNSSSSCTVCKRLLKTALYFFYIHHACNISAFAACGAFCSWSKSITEKRQIKQYLVEVPDMKERATQEYCFDWRRSLTHTHTHTGARAATTVWTLGFCGCIKHECILRLNHHAGKWLYYIKLLWAVCKEWAFVQACVCLHVYLLWGNTQFHITNLFKVPYLVLHTCVFQWVHYVHVHSNYAH